MSFLREIDPLSEAEIDLVARRMRETLIEVEGREVGEALYSLDWLRARVRWHLDPSSAFAKVYLAVGREDQILGHTIVRREQTEAGEPYGLFSTTYVVPEARRLGVAQQLLLQGERWMRESDLPSAATWTSATNTKLIALYEKHGYTRTQEHVHEATKTVMVKLEKALKPA